MARRGRKPRAPELSVHSGGDEAPPASSRSTRGDRSKLPRAPGYLDRYGREEWARITRELGRLTRADRAIVAVYCRVFSRWRRALQLLDQGELLVTSDTGVDSTHRAVAVASTAENTMHRLLSSLGATPAARHRMRRPVEPERNALAEFLGRRKA